MQGRKPQDVVISVHGALVPPRYVGRYFTIVCEVLVRVVQQSAVVLREPMDLHAGLKAEQFTNTGFREAVAPAPVQSYSFDGRSRRVRLS